MNTRSGNYAAPLLVVGCVVFGLGSLIVKFVDVGSYAIAFWRLLIAAPIFFLLGAFFQTKNAHEKEKQLATQSYPAFSSHSTSLCGMKAFTP